MIFVIATPPFMHYPMATKALESFKHVVCEPPLAINITDAKILSTMVCFLLAAAVTDHFTNLPSFLQSRKVQGRKSLLNLQLRFLPTVRKMKELITAGYCGKIFSVHLRMTDFSQLEEEA